VFIINRLAVAMLTSMAFVATMFIREVLSMENLNVPKHVISFNN
jgi:hydrogenase/urease accessory protein HupE